MKGESSLRLIRSALIAAALGFVSSAASAATIETLFGTNVKFTYDKDTQYGAAWVVGDSIFFKPTAFRAESLNGEGVVSNTETLNITIDVINPGYEITDFALAEQGDYFLNLPGTSVTASGRLGVTSTTTNCGIFACSDEDTFDVVGLLNIGSTTNWSGSTAISLGDTAGWGTDTGVVAQIQNNLSATTLLLGQQAWIQKKDQVVGVTVSVIPIPAAAWLFLSGLGALIGWGRVRRA